MTRSSPARLAVNNALGGGELCLCMLPRDCFYLGCGGNCPHCDENASIDQILAAAP